MVFTFLGVDLETYWRLVDQMVSKGLIDGRKLTVEGQVFLYLIKLRFGDANNRLHLQFRVGTETARTTFLDCLFKHYQISLKTTPMVSAWASNDLSNDKKNEMYAEIAKVLLNIVN